MCGSRRAGEANKRHVAPPRLARQNKNKLALVGKEKTKRRLAVSERAGREEMKDEQMKTRRGREGWREATSTGGTN